MVHSNHSSAVIANGPALPSQQGSLSERFEKSLQIILVFATALFALSAMMINNPGLKAALYLAAFVCGGYFGVLGAIEALKKRQVDVDLLMVLAAIGAACVGRPFEGVMLLFLFSLSNVLQNFAMDRTRSAIKALMKLRPETALRKSVNGSEMVPIDQLLINDHIFVRPGESVALDGEIIEGESTLDESSLTGESMPVNKRVGDKVFAGSINQVGGLEIRVSKLAKDSTLARIIALVESARSEKAQTQTFLEAAEGWYALGVITLTLVMIIFPPICLHVGWKNSFYRAMTVMVVASPCALVISTPASILSAIAVAARRGVLFKGGIHLERAATIQIVALDKTGTLTEGRPQVTEVVLVAEGMSKQEALLSAAAVESKSEHPLGQAILLECTRAGLTVPECRDFQAVVGAGSMGEVAGVRIAVGTERLFKGYQCERIECAKLETAMLQNQGKTVVWVAKLDPALRQAKILGLIAVADVVRPEAREVITRLKALGIKQTVMLTGDNTRVAAAIAKQVGIDSYYAELTPEDKVRLIRSLKEKGPVAMVGDGVNDAPALANTSLGIAMGAAGTDVAMETADVVLMNSQLLNIPFAFSLGRASQRVVYQNLVFAMVVILVLLVSALGFNLALPFGVIGHEGSTVLVCLNGLRLLLYRKA